MLNLDFSTARAPLCSVLLGLDDFARFLPKWQGFCQEQDDFPATGMVSVDSVSGSQKLDASSRLSLAFLFMSRSPENHPVAPGAAMRRSKGLPAPWTWIWPRTGGGGAGREKLSEYETPDNLNPQTLF